MRPSLGESFVFLSDLGNFTASAFESLPVAQILSPLYNQTVRAGISAISKVSLPRSTLGFLGSIPKVKVYVARFKTKLGRAGKILTRPEIGAIGAVAGGTVALASTGVAPLVLAGGIAVIAAGSIEQMNREKAKEEVEAGMAREVLILNEPYAYSQRIKKLRALLKLAPNKKAKRIKMDQNQLKKLRKASYSGRAEWAKGAVEMTVKYMAGPMSLAIGAVGKLGFIKTKVQASKTLGALTSKAYEIHKMKWSIARENPEVTIQDLSDENRIKQIIATDKKVIKKLQKRIKQKHQQKPTAKFVERLRLERKRALKNSTLGRS